MLHKRLLSGKTSHKVQELLNCFTAHVPRHPPSFLVLNNANKSRGSFGKRLEFNFFSAFLKMYAGAGLTMIGTFFFSLKKYFTDFSSWKCHFDILRCNIVAIKDLLCQNCPKKRNKQFYRGQSEAALKNWDSP